MLKENILELFHSLTKPFEQDQQKDRRIAGLSMGAYGSLHTAMRNPDQFAACAAFSSGVFIDEEIENIEVERYERMLGILCGSGLKGKDRLTDLYMSFNPLDLLDTQKIRKVAWYIDCGHDDFSYKGNATLFVKMRITKSHMNIARGMERITGTTGEQV